MHAITSGTVLALLAASSCSAACWQPAGDAGSLAFRVEQPGDSSISGEFTRFDGLVCLDPGNPGSARIRLRVETGSVETGLPELNEALRGSQFFGSDRWPMATFESDSVKKLKGTHRYRVNGTFTLRDVSRSMEVPFTFQSGTPGAAAVLAGTTTINRLDYGVGQGRWGDTQWADDEVKLEISVNLARADEQPARQRPAGDAHKQVRRARE